MTEDLTFRLYQPADVEGILRLWKEDSGWGEITREQFQNWFVNTPCGECLIAVAVDENSRVVAQEVFTPSRIFVKGEEKKAVRFSAPILAKDFRERLENAAHPTLEMFRVAMRAAIEKDFSVVYAFPARAWLRFTSAFVLPELGNEAGLTNEFDCVELSLEKFKTTENIKQYRVSIVKEFVEEFNGLWNKASKNFPINCSIVRDADWLKWKLGSHCVLAVKDGERFLGYAAFKKDTGLLVDALAENATDLEIVFNSAVNYLKSNYSQSGLKTNELKAMKTEPLKAILESAGFDPAKFKFGFWSYSLDKNISQNDIAPSRWYMMPKD